MNKMTENNLRQAFIDQSLEHVKHESFAKVADEEGFSNVARLLRAISYSHQVQATLGMAATGDVGATLDNVSKALSDEAYRVQQAYPAHIAVANLQREEDASRLLQWALETDKQHVNLYQEAKSGIEAGRDPELMAVFVCPVCGYTTRDGPPERCPLSGTPGGQFRGF